MRIQPLKFGLLLIFPLIAGAQTFQPVGNTQVMTVAQPISGPTLLTGTAQPLITIVTNVLYAEPDATVGQAAFDACTAGTVAPLASAAGLGAPSCENNRQAAMNTDAQARAKSGIAQIPAAILQQYKLHIVQ